MVKKIKSWLLKPFPFYETTGEKLYVPLYIALFIIIFEFAFNPSNDTRPFLPQLIKISAYGLITFIVAATINIICPKYFPKTFEVSRWKVWKMLIFSIIKVLLISIANASYAVYIDNGGQNIYFPTFLLYVTIYTFMIAIIPIVVIIMWLEKRFYQKSYDLAQKTNLLIEKKRVENKQECRIKFQGIEINIKTLLYAKSDGNYCLFYHEDNGKVIKEIHRITLKEIDRKLVDFNNFIRCHKSYIINLQKVKKIEGNSHQYKLILNGFDEEIPVSRILANSVIEKFNDKEG